MKLKIREAGLADAASIATFNNGIAEETENRSLDMAIVRPGVERLLGDRALGRYWVAEIDGKIVGQLMVTFEWSDWRNGMLWWIQSVYVDADHRRQGIFSALHRHVESLAKAEDDVIGLRLYVEYNNKRAQQTYETLGMSSPGYQVMQTIFGDD